MEWTDISYSVHVKKSKEETERKVLLKPMTGEALPGEVLAIMGPSGAGKSTLLDVLSARLDSSHLKGVIATNGTPIDKPNFRRMTGYVMQSDALFPLLTVRETFRYAAYLRIPGKTRAEKNLIADDMIKLLRLEKCADTIIGNDEHRGLSGGEKRRVSIGVDIIHRPSIIFLDEPTSGLDSTTAMQVIDTLKILAAEQLCTVLMTIHQPSARLFNMLDKVIFLADGKVTYSGHTKNLLQHIRKLYADAELGEVPVENPPELFLDLCQELATADKLHLATDQYRTGKTTELESHVSTLEEDAGPVIISHYANTVVGDTLILSERALTNVQRTPELFFARMGASLFFAVQIGTLFLFTANDTKGLNFRVAYFLFTIAFYNWTSLEALPIFMAEREIFQREFSRGAYRAIAYTIASNVVYWPFFLLLATIYCCVSYWLIGLPNYADVFFFFLFTVFTILVSANAFATMVSVLVKDPMTGQTAGSGAFSAMMLFSGIFISRNDIPDWWIYMHYLSLFKYAYDSMATNCFSVISTDTMTTSEVLHTYGMQNVNKGTGVGVLWLFTIFFRLVFYYRLITAFNGSRKK